MPKPLLIAPSILAADFTRLGEHLQAAEHAGADLLHIDVMDGQFVPNISFGAIVVEACRRVSPLPLDVHLMIAQPERFLSEFAKAGASQITVHFEATAHIHRAVHLVKELGLKVGLALNPGTPLEALKPLLPDLDLVLIMSVNPGFGGQKFIPSTLERLKTVRNWLEEVNPTADLQVDGGIVASNIAEAARVGANNFVAGSSVFNAKDTVQNNVNALKAALQVIV